MENELAKLGMSNMDELIDVENIRSNQTPTQNKRFEKSAQSSLKSTKRHAVYISDDDSIDMKQTPASKKQTDKLSKSSIKVTKRRVQDISDDEQEFHQKSSKKINYDLFDSDSGDIESVDLNSAKKRNVIKKPVPNLDSDEDVELIKYGRKSQQPQKNHQQLETNRNYGINYESSQEPSQTSSSNQTDIKIKEMLILQQQILQELKEQKEELRELKSTMIKKHHDNTFPTEVVSCYALLILIMVWPVFLTLSFKLFENKNLLEHHSTSFSKNITDLMPMLFTAKELSEGIIKTKNSTSTRKALDESRVSILKCNYKLNMHL